MEVQSNGGARLVRVPLVGGAEAVITEEARDHLFRMGYSGPWFIGQDRHGAAHVRCCRADSPTYKPAFAWRSVLRDPEGWRGSIVYRDGNPLNLIPDNVAPRWPRRRSP